MEEQASQRLPAVEARGSGGGRISTAGINRLPPFVRNLMTVMRGVVAAQVTMLLALPILTRLFPPQAFGLFQVFQSVLTVGLCVASFRYEIAIVTARSAKEVRTLVTMCVWLNIVVAVVVAVAAAIMLTLRIPALLPFHDLIIAAPIYFLFAGLLQTLSYAAISDGAFGLTSASKAVQVVVYAVIAIALGNGHYAIAVSLALADASSRLFAAYFLYRQGPRTLMPLNLRTLASLRLAAVRHRNFPLLSMPTALINSAGGMITPFLVLIWFGAAATGQFALLERTAGMAIGAIGGAVSQVFMNAFARTLRASPRDAHALFRRVCDLHLKLGFIPTIVLAALGPWIFATVFGEQWRQAGVFARYSAPYLLSMFVAAPVTLTLVLIRQQRAQLVWDTARLIGVVSVWTLAGLRRWDIETAVALHATVGCAIYIFYIWLTDHALRKVAGAAPTATPELVNHA